MDEILTKKLDAEKVLQIAALTLLVLVLVGINYFAPGFYDKVWQLSKSGDIEGTVEYLRSFGTWAIFISFFIDVLINCLGFLPSIFVSTANGLLFGLPLGILISWTAECIGVIISFFIMRFFLRDVAIRLIEKSSYLQKLDEISGKNGLTVMALARSMPYFPSGILTALGAASKISVRDYIIATFIGKFPSTVIEVVLGHDVVNYEENMTRLAVVVILVIVIYATIFYYNRKKQ